MVLDIKIGALTLTKQNFTVGDTVKVVASFSYAVGVNTTIKINAGPYYTNVFGRNIIQACVGSTSVQLTATQTPVSKQVTINFPLTPKASGGMDDGTYGLMGWVDGSSFSASTQDWAAQDNLLVVSGNPASMWDTLTGMLPMLLLFMMMGMMMPMMQGMTQSFGGTQQGGQR